LEKNKALNPAKSELIDSQIKLLRTQIKLEEVNRKIVQLRNSISGDPAALKIVADGQNEILNGLRKQESQLKLEIAYLGSRNDILQKIDKLQDKRNANSEIAKDIDTGHCFT